MSTSKMVFTCATADGDKTFSYNYADPQATSSSVRQAATALVTNGSIFATPPISVKTAKLVTTTETPYSLS